VGDGFQAILWILSVLISSRRRTGSSRWSNGRSRHLQHLKILIPGIRLFKTKIGQSCCDKNNQDQARVLHTDNEDEFFKDINFNLFCKMEEAF